MPNKYNINSISNQLTGRILYLVSAILLSTSTLFADNKSQTATVQSPALPTLTPANQLQAIENYLNSFRTLQARFQQIKPNGTSVSGTLYLWRPGRMRLTYDQADGQNPLLQRIIVANGDSFFDHNPEMDETTEIPVDATPASFIMRDRIHFGHDIQVIDNQIRNTMLAITLAKRDDRDTGTLTLCFNPSPLTLLEWEIVDSQQLHTRVILDAIETGIKLDAKLFNTNF